MVFRSFFDNLISPPMIAIRRLVGTSGVGAVSFGGFYTRISRHSGPIIGLRCSLRPERLITVSTSQRVTSSVLGKVRV